MYAHHTRVTILKQMLKVYDDEESDYEDFGEVRRWVE